MCVTCLISLSSPEAVQLDEEAALVGAGVGEGGVVTISGGDLDADTAVAEQLISCIVGARSSWLLISQLHVLTTLLSTPLSLVSCAEEAGFFLEDRRLNL